MDEYASAGPGDSAGSGQGIIALFLGLYLLVLAFFILLVSISTREPIKSRAVMDSLNSTFTSLLPPRAELRDFVSLEGHVVTGQVFQQEVSKLFSTSIKAVKVETIQPGRIMRAVFDTATLFAPDDATLKDGNGPLLDRLVASLSGRPPGMRFDMEFVAAVPAAATELLPVERTLAMRRGEAFVRELLSRGAPPDSLSIGIRPGNPDQIAVWFWVRNVDEDRRRLAASRAAGGR